MNKTVLGLDESISIIVLSALGIFFTFVGSYELINSMVSFLFIIVKCIVFVGVPFIVYVLEKNSLGLKKVAGIYTSYFIINLLMTIITSFFIVNGNVGYFCKYLLDLVNLIILLSCLFILIEQILDYANIHSRVYKNTIMKIVYIVGNFISYPFLNYINRKRQNNK